MKRRAKKGKKKNGRKNGKTLQILVLLTAIAALIESQSAPKLFGDIEIILRK